MRRRAGLPRRAWVVGVSRLNENYERVVRFCASEEEARAMVRLANQHAPADVLYFAEDWYPCYSLRDSLGPVPEDA